MNIRGIVAVSGKPGLWKVIAQNKTGFVLESLDEQKTKLVANLSTAKLAALDEITIFGTEEDLKLTDIFEKMKSAQNVPDAKADGRKLREFFYEVAPDHDEEKVYASDMKKVIQWFNLLKDEPFFNEAPEAQPAAESSEAPQEESPEAVAAEAPVDEPAESKKKKSTKKAG